MSRRSEGNVLKITGSKLPFWTTRGWGSRVGTGPKQGHPKASPNLYCHHLSPIRPWPLSLSPSTGIQVPSPLPRALWIKQARESQVGRPSLMVKERPGPKMKNLAIPEPPQTKSHGDSPLKKNTKIARGYGERGREKRERAIGGGGREAGCQRHRERPRQRESYIQ